jgi:uncharacterized FlaG/YvyC family protein
MVEKLDHLLDDELAQPSCLLFSLDFMRGQLWCVDQFFIDFESHLKEHATNIGKNLHQVQETFNQIETMLKQSSTRSSTTTTTTRKMKSTQVTNQVHPMATFVDHYKQKMRFCVEKLIERSLITFVNLLSTESTNYQMDQSTIIRLISRTELLDEHNQSIDFQRVK